MTEKNSPCLSSKPPPPLEWSWSLWYETIPVPCSKTYLWDNLKANDYVILFWSDSYDLLSYSIEHGVVALVSGWMPFYQCHWHVPAQSGNKKVLSILARKVFPTNSYFPVWKYISAVLFFLLTWIQKILVWNSQCTGKFISKSFEYPFREASHFISG